MENENSRKISLRINSSQYEELHNEAEVLGISFSDHIRNRIFGNVGTGIEARESLADAPAAIPDHRKRLAAKRSLILLQAEIDKLSDRSKTKDTMKSEVENIWLLLK